MSKFLNFAFVVSVLIGVSLYAADSSVADCDSSSLIFSDLERADLQSCRLVCFEWRAAVDWYLKNRAKRKKVEPVLSPLEESDFLRLVSIDLAHNAYKKGKYAKAFSLFSAAASHDRGNAHAAYMTGHMFLLGQGVNKSIREGLYQLHLAAEAGFSPALYDLGLIFHTGRDSKNNSIVAKDLGKAFAYYQQAHESGYSKATYHLGLMYYEGLHVKKDQECGISLISLAAANGDKNAIEALTIIKAVN